MIRAHPLLFSAIQSEKLWETKATGGRLMSVFNVVETNQRITEDCRYWSNQLWVFLVLL